MNIKKSTVIKILVLVVIVLAFILIKPLNQFFKTMISSFKSVDEVKSYIQSFGIWAVTISFLMMVLQSVAAPIPAFFVTFANAMVWGWAWGALLSWSSAMVGAALCFFLSRLYGRGIAEKFASKTALASVDKFFIKYGKNAILISRLLPFVPFDPISYAAGLTGMGFLGFFIATGIGQLPATIIYSYAAANMTTPSTFLKGLLIMFGVVAIVYFIKILWTEKNKKDNMIAESQ